MSTNLNYLPTISFTNFRRFANFPKIDLGEITILVGGNNSGKSTIVKALLLCIDNLPFFPFQSHYSVLMLMEYMISR